MWTNPSHPRNTKQRREREGAQVRFWRAPVTLISVPATAATKVFRWLCASRQLEDKSKCVAILSLSSNSRLGWARPLQGRALLWEAVGKREHRKLRPVPYVVQFSWTCAYSGKLCWRKQCKGLSGPRSPNRARFTELDQSPGPLICLRLLWKEGILVRKERRKTAHRHMRADVWPVLSAPCVWAFKSLYVSPALSCCCYPLRIASPRGTSTSFECAWRPRRAFVACACRAVVHRARNRCPQQTFTLVAPTDAPTDIFNETRRCF